MDTTKLETVAFTKTENTEVSSDMAEEVARYAGVSTKDTSAILSAALPLLASSLSGSNNSSSDR